MTNQSACVHANILSANYCYRCGMHIKDWGKPEEKKCEHGAIGFCELCEVRKRWEPEPTEAKEADDKDIAQWIVDNYQFSKTHGEHDEIKWTIRRAIANAIAKSRVELEAKLEAAERLTKAEVDVAAKHIQMKDEDILKLTERQKELEKQLRRCLNFLINAECPESMLVDIEEALLGRGGEK